MTLVHFGCGGGKVDDSPAMPVERTEIAINLNTAAADELEKLPFVGDSMAAEIVEFRERNGRFHRVEQLLLLRGMSERRFREIRRFVTAE
jgi:competence ComEA-like helix-hairpin-helix protein